LTVVPSGRGRPRGELGAQWLAALPSIVGELLEEACGCEGLQPARRPPRTPAGRPPSTAGPADPAPPHPVAAQVASPALSPARPHPCPARPGARPSRIDRNHQREAGNDLCSNEPVAPPDSSATSPRHRSQGGQELSASQEPSRHLHS